MDHPDELQAIVRMAKNFENEGNLKESKHKFLDAADFALKTAKSGDSVHRLTYQNIARELVKYAKDLQMEILLEHDELPLPPGHPERKVKTQMKKQQEKQTEKIQKQSTELFRLLIIREGGIPVFSYSFNEISNATKLKLNEILFSGAITAINQIMMEVLEKSIQTIKFDEGVLLVHTMENLFITLYASNESDELQSQIKNYCESLFEKFGKEIETSIMSGKTMNDDPVLVTHLKSFFT